MKNNRRTFWSVINEQKIEIPTIQRDYAQGRNIPKIKKIREKFINDLVKSLEEEKILPLDFVYGKEEGRKSQELIRKNKKSLEDLLVSIKSYANSLDITFDYDKIVDKNEGDLLNIRKLLPLDGQQRLTTLFLLHWYLAKRLGEINVLETLKKFTYKTRRSSSSFIDSICNENCDPDFSKEDFKEEILFQPNFSYTWKKDPTVRGMITTLSFIHKVCFVKQDDELIKFLELLTSTQLIYFDYLDLKDFDLTDDLYVKMNARGKFLTEFENFKAWLFGIIEDDEDNFGIREWSKQTFKFDIEWNDIFWNAKTDKVYKIDNAFLQYFKLMYISDYLKSMTVDHNKLIDVYTEDYNYTDQELDEITKTVLDKNGDKVFDFELYFDNQLFSDNVSSYFKLLDRLSNESLVVLDTIIYSSISLFNSTDDKFSTLYFSEKSLNFSWISFIERYLVLKYIEKKGKDITVYSELEKLELQKYVRIMLNLLHNKTIANKHLYFQALESIDLILNNLDFDDVENWMLLNEIPFFDESQIEEEKIKLMLTSFSEEWKKRIYKAEKHRYFKGQINFLLKYSGIYDLFRQNNDVFIEDVKTQNYSLISRFDDYYYKFNCLFDEKGLRSHIDINVFKSAILNFGFYFVNVGHQKYHTLQNTSRDYSWKRILGESIANNEYSKKSVFIKNLVDNITDYEDINESLYEIINFNKNFVTHNDFLIHYPTMFTDCKNNLIRYHQEIGENGYSYLVFSVNVNYPKDKEIHLYAVEKELERNGYQVNSHFDEEGENHFINSINDEEIRICFVYSPQVEDWKNTCFFKVEFNDMISNFFDFHKCIDFIKENIRQEK